TVQIVRQGEATLYWFLLIHYNAGTDVPCRRNCWYTHTAAMPPTQPVSYTPPIKAKHYTAVPTD
ncbi:hypothetical protein CWI48_11285, partial [Neisseria meningitidis]